MHLSNDCPWNPSSHRGLIMTRRQSTQLGNMTEVINKLTILKVIQSPGTFFQSSLCPDSHAPNVFRWLLIGPSQSSIEVSHPQNPRAANCNKNNQSKLQVQVWCDRKESLSSAQLHAHQTALTPPCYWICCFIMHFRRPSRPNQISLKNHGKQF